MLILVLEASTASAKAMLYQSETATGAGAPEVLSRNYSAAAGDIASYDADQMMAETMALGRRLLAQKGVTRVDMVATCSIWGHSLLMLDRNHKPVARLKTWADTSAAATTRKYRKDKALFNAFYQRTGCPIHTTYTLWKYIHEKEYGGVKDVSLIAAMPDYLFYKLSGEFAVSQSTTSAGGFLNIHSLQWDRETLNFAGIDDSMLPQLVDSEYTGSLTREAAGALGLPEGTPVLITGADGCMNQVAAGAFGDSIMTVSVGTSAAMRLSTSRPVLAAYPSTWCYAGVENMWVAGCAIAGAGNCVDWIGKKILGSHNGVSLKQLDDGAAGTLEKGDAPFFLPFPAGERCPGWDDTKNAMLLGMKIDHDGYDLYYSVLEGVLFNLKQCYDLTVPIVGQPPKLISISGGIEQSPFWLALAASVFDAPVYTGGLQHASLLGAALMGLKAAGEITTVKNIQPALEKRWEARLDKKELLAQRYAQYLHYYQGDLESANPN